MRNPDIASNGPPVILIDPAYHANIGDVFISYGELVFIERMGYLNHTECGVLSSHAGAGLINQKCGNFSQFPNGGLALWHGN